jgi:(2R)-ethylmalonyl-CoA mutase
VALLNDVMERLRKENADDIPVVVGGIIPPEDEVSLRAMGVAAIYTPKDFRVNMIMADIVRLVEESAAVAA